MEMFRVFYKKICANSKLLSFLGAPAPVGGSKWRGAKLEGKVVECLR